MAQYISDGATAYEADLDNLIMALKGSGIVSDTDCAVAAQGSPDMTVAVAAGQVVVDGTVATVSSGNVAISASDPSNSRIDLITVDTAGTKAAVTGTPSATPKPPALPAGRILLALISVAAAAVNIQNSNISNRRLRAQNDQKAVASGVNMLTTSRNVAGQGPLVRSEGSDTNIAMSFSTKGTGNFGFFTGNFARTVLSIENVASSVNYIRILPNATGNPASVRAAGSDADVGLLLSSKGASSVQIFSGDGAREIARLANIASSVNFHLISPSATGNGVRIEAAGTDANIDYLLSSKGTGTMQFYSGTFARTLFNALNVASSVNFLSISPSATTNPIDLAASGTDANVSIQLSPKGTGNVLNSRAYSAGAQNSFRLGMKHHAALANNGVAQLGNLADFVGLVFVYDRSSAVMAIYSCNGGLHTTTEIQDPSGTFTITATNAGTTNIYWSAGNSRYELENKRGGARDYYVYLFEGDN